MNRQNEIAEEEDTYHGQGEKPTAHVSLNVTGPVLFTKQAPLWPVTELVII